MTRQFILASGSRARKDMLYNAGFDFDAIPADIDETALINVMDGEPPEKIALTLAAEKALAVAGDYPDTPVIGADQILVLDGRIIQKAPDKDAAIDKLRNLSGKTHELISAVSIAQGGKIVWQHADSARLTMRALSDNEIKSYADRAGEALTKSVGAYELEGIGAGLFEKIDGDYFTILGLPLLPLIQYLGTKYKIRSF